MNYPLVLVFDVGTQSVRAALVDKRGNITALAQEVYDLFASRAAAMHRLFLRWKKTCKEWSAANPEKAAARDAAYANAIPSDLAAKLPVFDQEKPVATRGACGTVMNAIAKEVPFLVGGSADLAPSNKTYLKGLGDVGPGAYSGRNFHFGIRELAMTSVVNGIVAHGGFRAFGATFFVFSDYCKPAMRLAALMKLPSIWVFSHDSFYVGEDGPTHEPVEQMAMLRAMPNVAVFRPADANETGYCWVEMLKNTNGPSCILTTRQNLPILEGTSAEGVAKGAYIVFGTDVDPDGVLVTSEECQHTGPTHTEIVFNGNNPCTAKRAEVTFCDDCGQPIATKELTTLGQAFPLTEPLPHSEVHGGRRHDRLPC